MMAIIIGKNHVAYQSVRRKDLTKRLFFYRNQMYIVHPEELKPIEIYHDGAWVASESAIVFPENCPLPLHVSHPARYTMDARLSFIDELKLMGVQAKKWSFNFSLNKILDYLPIIALGFIGLVILGGMIL